MVCVRSETWVSRLSERSESKKAQPIFVKLSTMVPVHHNHPVIGRLRQMGPGRLTMMHEVRCGSGVRIWEFVLHWLIDVGRVADGVEYPSCFVVAFSCGPKDARQCVNEEPSHSFATVQ